MTNYRLYCIRRGHFFHCEAFDASDDDEAAARALELRGSDAAELWSGARKVREFPVPATLDC
jgi:hypothetical protein